MKLGYVAFAFLILFSIDIFIFDFYTGNCGRFSECAFYGTYDFLIPIFLGLSVLTLLMFVLLIVWAIVKILESGKENSKTR